MNIRTALAASLAALLLTALGTAHAQDDGFAAEAYAQGTALLSEGDFEGALEALGQAAGADDAPAEYKKKYIQVRAMTKMRAQIADEDDAEKWWTLATRLRNFYYQLRLYEELYDLADEMHDRRGTVGTASLLADASLILGRNAKAEKVLTSMDAEELTLQAKLLLGVAQARQGEKAAAKSVLADMEIPEQVSPRFLSDLARLQVLNGDVDMGLATLTEAFEKTAPAGLESFRSYVKATPDFASVPADRFAKALATESKVTASSCSGGDSCGSCPKSGTCEGSTTQ